MEYQFTKEQINEYKDYFLKHGFCVIINILNNERIKSTIDEIWEHPSLLNDGIIKKDSPQTWESWPTDNKGFLDLKAGYSEIYLNNYWKDHLDKNIVNVYENLYDEEVKCYPDRIGIMRPTRGEQGKQEWKTSEGWLHLDSNPWDIKPKIQLQGLLTLTKQDENSGGFCCIPNFHLKIADWAEKNKELLNQNANFDDIYYFQKNTKEYEDIVKLEAPAGSLIIWDDRIPHSNYPNNNEHFRIVEYMNYYRASQINQHHKNRLAKIGLEISYYNYLQQNQIENKNLNNSEQLYLLTETNNKQKNLIDFDKYVNNLNQKEINGYIKYKEATKQESLGNVDEAIKLYSSAYKLCPITENF